MADNPYNPKIGKEILETGEAASEKKSAHKKFLNFHPPQSHKVKKSRTAPKLPFSFFFWGGE
jgi:hypothetical protein